MMAISNDCGIAFDMGDFQIDRYHISTESGVEYRWGIYRCIGDRVANVAWRSTRDEAIKYVDEFYIKEAAACHA